MEADAFAVRATRFAFSALGAVAPEPMAALAERLYFAPRRHAAPARERAVLEDARAFTLDTPAGPLAAWRFLPWFPWERAVRGTVLLVHGWEGRAAQLGSFVQPLLEQGFAVVAADAPAHGRSPGEALDLPMYTACIEAVARETGDVRAIVAHSFGCAAALLALASPALSAVDATVLVAPPASLERFASEFARIVGLTKATEAIFRARLDDRFGKEWVRTFALDERARRVKSAALVVHDDDDAEVPAAEGALLARSFEHAELLTTHGLGHRRILRDHNVVARAARFVDAHVA